ncbi:MAG: DUF1385 domain-containing protein [Acidobacteriota bacterium]
MKPQKEIIVGGQAVIEGVMMRAPNSYAVAVRRSDGSMALKAEALPRLDEKYPFLKIPILRGSVVLIHSMLLGIKALNFSATVVFEDQTAEEGEKVRRIEPALEAAAVTGALMTTAHAIESPYLRRELAGTEPVATEKGQSGVNATATAAGSIAFALFFNVLLFIVLPLLVTNAIFINFGWGNAPQFSLDSASLAAEPWYREAWLWLQAYMKPVRPSVAFNLVDGLIRMSFFIVMIWTFSKMRDIKRVFEYHGAEHKTVYAWEAGQDLTVANARRFPRQHPRCGTSFLMIVMLVSIVLFSVVKFDSLAFNMLTRIALIPLIAGISYEIIRAAGKKETSAFFSFITRPGIWMQNLTTREPSDDQLEVAIYALTESLKLEPQRDLEPQRNLEPVPLS